MLNVWKSKRNRTSKNSDEQSARSLTIRTISRDALRERDVSVDFRRQLYSDLGAICDIINDICYWKCLCTC